MAEAQELRREGSAESLLGAWLKFFSSSVGSKFLMAITGAGLWLFLVAHLAGNLTAFIGRDAFNQYAAALHAKPALLWVVRLPLLAAFPLHVVMSIRAARLNRAARPMDYAYPSKAPASWASKYMIGSGLVVLAFIAFHLGHFTFRAFGLGPDAESLSAFELLIRGFRNPGISGLYVLGVALLSQHLAHGLYSMFQHLGLWGRRWTPWVKGVAVMVGVGMCLLFASLPVAVLLGVVRP